MTSRRLFAHGLALATLAGLALTIVVSLFAEIKQPTDSTSGDQATFWLVPIAYAIVGWLVSTRRPGNRVGWLCGAVGSLFTLVALQETVAGWLAARGDIAAARWVGTLVALWVPALGILAVLLPLLLPDGRVLSRRWEVYYRLCTAVIGLTFLLVLIDPASRNALPGVDNPLAVPTLQPLQVLFVLFPLTFVGAVASLVVRYRRAAGAQRAQLRWIALGGSCVLLTYAVPGLLITVGALDENAPGLAVWNLIAPDTFAILPICIGVAVLRYRLYEIDRIVNRAVVYATLTGALVTTYVGSVLLLGLVMRPVTHSSNLTIAGSTLLVAAVFRPARVRIQSEVDRRFFRHRYDAQRTIEQFAGVLRTEVQISSIQRELRDVVTAALQPAHVSVWVRRERP